jgi:preprotein translocase subunit YajC
MFLIEIFFCLFYKFRGSKPPRTRTQNREKQRNSLIFKVSNINGIYGKIIRVSIMKFNFSYYSTYNTDLTLVYVIKLELSNLNRLYGKL